MSASKFMSFLSAAAWRVAEPLHLVPVVTAPTGPPPTVPSDEVFPVHYFDDTFVNRKMIMCWTMKFDDVLDPEALRSSLARLLEIGDWRKLGGRLRLIEKTGKLEIHVPEKFTAERPAVRYSHVNLDISIDEDPLASQLPKATDVPSLHPGPMRFRSLGSGPGSPTTIEDYLNSDNPQLALHIISYTDATLVSLSWPHTMTDAMGRRALITAWCQVLAGNESEVAPLLGAREDAASALGAALPTYGQEEAYALAEKQLRGLQILFLMFRSLWDILFMPKVLQTIVFTRQAVSRLVQEARDDISNDDQVDKGAFVSEGDVLTAWSTRMAALALPRGSTRSIVVGTVFELRGRLKSIFQSGGVYIQNLVFSATAVLPAAEVLGKPLGHVALAIRRTITMQTSESQIRAQAQALRRSLDGSGHMPGFGDASSLIVGFSNWTKGDFFNVVDFGPAVVHKGEERRERAGKPVYFHSQTHEETPMAINIFNILGRDAEGNMWITGYLPPSVWLVVEEELRRLA